MPRDLITAILIVDLAAFPQVIVTAQGSQPPETQTGSRFLRGNRNHSPTTQNADRTETPYRTIAEKAHRWGIHFDGHSDPLSFIERVEERAAAHLIDLAHLSQAIPELLTGNSTNWFRVSRLQGASSRE
ncbi:hypothetical protein ACLKA6_003194 [Drosophila palustris]